MMEWLDKEWDYASWSESTKDSAIMGTVDECVEQLKAHLAVGMQKHHFCALQVRDGADRDDRRARSSRGCDGARP